MAHTTRMPRLRLAGVFLLLISLTSAACRARSEERTDAPVLRVGFGIGPTARAEGVNVLTGLLYAEPLVMHDWNGRPVSILAERWDWEDERKTLRIRLKPNVKFHNGSPLTSDLVVRFLEQNSGRGLGSLFVTDISAPDPATVLIKLSKPDAFLLTELSERRITHPEAPDISTGPFRLVSRSPAVQTVRFDDYHGGKSALGGVRIVTYDTHRSAWAALLRDDVDVVQEVSRESVEFMQRSSNVQTFSLIQPFYIYLAFNNRHPALRHVEVRRALSQALDREAIVQRAMRGRGRVAEGPIWPFHWAYAPLIEKDRHDPAEAAKRLDDAGFAFRPAKAGEQRTRFTFKCLVWNEEPQYERIAQIVQRQLFAIGVDLQLEPLPLNELVARASAGDFDAYLMQANASRSVDWTYQFWRSPGAENRSRQNSGYAGADELFDRFRHSTSDEEMRQALAAISKRLHDDAPAAFIAWLESTRAVDSSFVVGELKFPDPFANIWQWRPVAENAKP